MSRKGHFKKPEAERRQIAQRYETWRRDMRRNAPKRICYEHSINRETLRQYYNEFRGQFRED